MLRFLFPVVKKHVLPKLGQTDVRIDALAIVRQHEELDMAGQREHCPSGLRKYGRRDGIRLRHECVTVGHPRCAHALDATEELLVFDLFVPHADQRLERSLITQPVLAAHVEHLGRDEALDQAEYVGVGPTLDLAKQALLIGGEEAQAIDLRQPVGQEPLREVEAPAANHVAIDIPPDALGHLDTLGVTRGIDVGLHGGLHGN